MCRIACFHCRPHLIGQLRREASEAELSNAPQHIEMLGLAGNRGRCLNACRAGAQHCKIRRSDKTITT
jgi:hypothetical protein